MSTKLKRSAGGEIPMKGEETRDQAYERIAKHCREEIEWCKRANMSKDIIEMHEKTLSGLKKSVTDVFLEGL